MRAPPLLLILIVYYGFPALLIREAAVRWKLSVIGIFLLGLAYGIYNEGVAARTLYPQHNVPVPTFDNYGYFFGINFSWLPTILVFHALNSILYPIATTAYLFPSSHGTPLLGRWAMLLLGAVSILVPLLIPSSLHPLMIQAIPLIMASLILGYLAKRWGAGRPIESGPALGPSARVRAAMTGGFFLLAFWAGFFLATLHVPLAVYWLYLVAILFGYYLSALPFGVTMTTIAMFAAGGYFLESLFGIARSLAAPDMSVVEAAAALCFLAIIFAGGNARSCS